MTDKNIPEYKSCVYYCYGDFCNRNYAKERKAFGWTSVVEYKCKKKCYLYRKNNWWNRFLRAIFG